MVAGGGGVPGRRGPQTCSLEWLPQHSRRTVLALSQNLKQKALELKIRHWRRGVARLRARLRKEFHEKRLQLPLNRTASTKNTAAGSKNLARMRHMKDIATRARVNQCTCALGRLGRAAGACLPVHVHLMSSPRRRAAVGSAPWLAS